MLGLRNGGSAARRLAGLGALALILAATPGPAALAQPGYYGAPGAYEEERFYRAPPRRAPREASGLNCAAVQQGISGPQPYSCPLPGPRPLGARCYCDLPIASFSPPQTAVGRVVP